MLQLDKCNENAPTGLHPRIIRIRKSSFVRHPWISTDYESSSEPHPRTDAPKSAHLCRQTTEMLATSSGRPVIDEV